MNKKNYLITLAMLVFIVILAFIIFPKPESTSLSAGAIATSSNIPAVTSIATNSNSLDLSADGPLVIIDPGHGGWEPGAVYGDFMEKDIVLDISLELEAILKEKKINHYIIRHDDSYHSLKDRSAIANGLAGDIFVSIHNNSYEDKLQNGILTIYNPKSPISKEIAEIMQPKLAQLGMKDRGAMPHSNLSVLKNADMPALLLEIGFMSNKDDLSLLTSQEFQKNCAGKIAEGIEDILSKLIKSDPTTSDPK